MHAEAAFFSYSHEDSDFALRLAQDLKAAGAKVWIDQLDIEPGIPWDRSVEGALNSCPRTLVILSPVSVESDNVRDEVSFALSKRKRIIPVLYRECNVPFRLARLQHIDFRTDYPRGLGALLRALGVEQPPPQRLIPIWPEVSRIGYFVRWKSAMNALFHSWRAVLYVFVALAGFFFVNQDEILRGVGLGECERLTIPKRTLYQLFVTIGHSMRAHRVAVVSYATRDIPSLADPCEKRALVAAVIERLATPEIAPSVIVLDHWYDPAYCRQDPQAQQRSNELSAALAAVSANIPIVLGADSDSWDALSRDPELPKLAAKGFSRNDQILRPSAFAGPNLSFGLLRIDCDNRRIPLQWWVYPSKDELLKGAGRISVPGLAYEAARLADGGVAQALQPLISRREHPFTGFMPEREFSTLKDGKPLTASAILCGASLRGTAGGMIDQTSCTPLTPEGLRLLRGSVVLLGEDSPGDWHPSVLGNAPIPGYVLTANYIDALLTDYYFRSLNVGVELVLTLVGILLLVTVFELAPSIWSGFLASAGAVVMMMIVCFVLIYFKWFSGFWLSLVPIPILQAIYWLRQGSKRLAAPGSTNVQVASAP